MKTVTLKRTLAIVSAVLIALALYGVSQIQVSRPSSNAPLCIAKAPIASAPSLLQSSQAASSFLLHTAPPKSFSATWFMKSLRMILPLILAAYLLRELRA